VYVYTTLKFCGWYKTRGQNEKLFI